MAYTKIMKEKQLQQKKYSCIYAALKCLNIISLKCEPLIYAYIK